MAYKSDKQVHGRTGYREPLHPHQSGAMEPFEVPGMTLFEHYAGLALLGALSGGMAGRNYGEAVDQALGLAEAMLIGLESRQSKK